MPLNKYQKFCYRVFGKIAEKRASEKLKSDLGKANIDIRPAAYLSEVWMNTVLSTIILLTVFAIMVFWIFPMMKIELVKDQTIKILFTLIIPLAIGFMVYISYMYYPRSRAKTRGKKIDQSLPYALNFISAMSAAGIAPHEIFLSLSKQNIYGEVKVEAARMAKDMKLLGLDIITALKRAIERTPSNRFKEFLQGAVVTVTSGGALKPYFMLKADQYMRENRQIQKQFLETLGIMAESYVVAAVAAPLFVLIVVVLFSIIRGSASQMIFLYLFVLLILPLIHIGFAFAIKLMTPEV